MVTGAFLAESAISADNKLYVWGGVFDSCQVGPDRLARFVLIVLLQFESGDTDDDVAINVEFISPDGGRAVVHVAGPPGIGGINGFLFNGFEIPAPVDGQYVLVVDGAQGAISLPIQIHG